MFSGRRKVERLGVVVLIAGLLWRATALADGGVIIEEDLGQMTQEEAAEAELVSSNGQRALLVRWPGDEQWELFVEPGRLLADGAVWLLPLPGIPEVSAASSEFLEQLDAVTFPVFKETVHYRRTTYSSGSCAFSFGGGAAELEETGSSSQSETVADVAILGEGRLGAVGYEVLSVTDANELEHWLAEQGYVVPDGLAGLAAPYVDRGYSFFAARLVRSDVDPELLPAFRFPSRQPVGTATTSSDIRCA